MSKVFLSVVVPVHNDSRHILLTLLDIHRHLEQRPYSSEIIAIDNNSSDSTAEMINRYQALIKNLQLIRQEKTLPKGETISQGLLLANGQWRLVLPAEGHVPLDEFDKILPYANAGYEIFSSPDETLFCVSAKAAELIATGRGSSYRRRAKRLGYKVKTVRLRKKSASSPLAWLKRLWHNLKTIK